MNSGVSSKITEALTGENASSNNAVRTGAASSAALSIHHAKAMLYSVICLVAVIIYMIAFNGDTNWGDWFMGVAAGVFGTGLFVELVLKRGWRWIK